MEAGGPLNTWPFLAPHHCARVFTKARVKAGILGGNLQIEDAGYECRIDRGAV